MNIQIKGNYNYSTSYKRGEIVRYSPNSATGWKLFMSVIDNNKGNTPNPRMDMFGWVPFDSSFKTLEPSSDIVPICTINSEGTSGGIPSNWTVTVPTSTERLNKMPKINLATGLLTVPAGIEGYYTKDEVDALVGDLGTILDKINGEVI